LSKYDAPMYELIVLRGRAAACGRGKHAARTCPRLPSRRDAHERRRVWSSAQARIAAVLGEAEECEQSDDDGDVTQMTEPIVGWHANTADLPDLGEERGSLSVATPSFGDDVLQDGSKPNETMNPLISCRA
jgi:hypothetical protein